ncbi:hypothetical protein FJZ17_04190 [Candidatus Pacearchaeota archaeon]|nr:hypothetical protein [Candidatus Pacearchaeota archaeon]
MKKHKENKKRSKKSQSNIIVTVLLVLVGLVAVGILASWIIGFARTNTEITNARIELNLDASNSFNGLACIGPCAAGGEDKTSFVRVTRGSGNVELTGISFVFSFNGETKVSETRQRLPGELEYKTYYKSYNSDEAYPDSVEIAPIIEINGKEKVLPVVSKVKLITKTGYFDKTLATSIISSEATPEGLPL